MPRIRTFETTRPRRVALTSGRGSRAGRAALCAALLAPLLAACGALANLGEPLTVGDRDAGMPRDALVDDSSTTGDDSGNSPDVADAAPMPALTIALAPSSVRLIRPGSVATQVTVDRHGAPPNAVDVTVSGLPADVIADSLVIDADASAGQLTLHAKATATLTVDAVAQVSATSPLATATTAPLPVIVQGAPGSLDETFGDGGVATVLVPNVSAAGIGTHGLAIQPDGRILYCGGATDPAGYYELALGRLSRDGAPDTTFAGTGVFTTIPSGYNAEICLTVRLLPSGTIATSGFADRPGENGVMFAAEFTSTGAAETSFGNAGLVAIDDNNVDSKAYDMLVQPSDGKLVLGGFLPYGTPALVRLQANGAADPSFDPGATGSATIGIDTFTTLGGNQINSLALLPNGEIIAAIDSTSFAGAEFTAGGKVDGKYGASGRAFNPAPGSSFSGPAAVVVQPDGAAVYVGSNSTTILLARFDAQGQLDGSFGTGGVASPALPAGAATPVSAALTSDGRFVVSAILPGGEYGVVRYTSSGALDTAFNGVGYVGLSPGVGSTVVNGYVAVALDDTGRVVLGTMLTNQTTNVATASIARFWP